MIIIRSATAADLAAVAALAVLHTAPQRPSWRAQLRDDLTATGRCVLVAADDDQPGDSQLVGYGRVRHFEPTLQAAADVAPAGYYLSGMVVHPGWRHQHIGERLTRARMAWTAALATEVWYFTNAANQASLRLHQRLGFREVTRDFTFPGVTFAGGTGVLCRATLAPYPTASRRCSS